VAGDNQLTSTARQNKALDLVNSQVIVVKIIFKKVIVKIESDRRRRNNQKKMKFL
tara:strand:+ start:18650 stop:18814 length:165 start_codon:yes stop_codon:yes gene_type:complete